MIPNNPHIFLFTSKNLLDIIANVVINLYLSCGYSIFTAICCARVVFHRGTEVQDCKWVSSSHSFKLHFAVNSFHLFNKLWAYFCKVKIIPFELINNLLSFLGLNYKGCFLSCEVLEWSIPTTNSLLVVYC